MGAKSQAAGASVARWGAGGRGARVTVARGAWERMGGGGGRVPSRQACMSWVNWSSILMMRCRARAMRASIARSSTVRASASAPVGADGAAGRAAGWGATNDIC